MGNIFDPNHDNDGTFEPTPVPLGDGRHDIGDTVRAAIANRLIEEWAGDRDLSPEKVRQMAMWAAASVRSLLHELGTLRDLVRPEALDLPTLRYLRSHCPKIVGGYQVDLETLITEQESKKADD